MKQLLSLTTLCLCLTTQACFGADAPAEAKKPDYSSELPRIDPQDPKEALQHIQLRAGYSIQQTAAEPLVADPVAMSFDEDGKLYVVEMRDYSEQDTESLGVVRLLEDTDQDGSFDKSTIFAEGLSWPTAIICYGGGVFVGAPPHLMYLKDTNGDKKADEQRIVFTGFGRSNVQGLMNSLRWGLDNRIHGATSSSGGVVKRPDVPNDPGVNLSGRDFSFGPNKLDIRAESGGAQHGMSFDDWGRKFVCSNSRHIQFVAYNDRYIARNPRLAPPSPRIDIAVEGNSTEVYRLSPVEPWRIVRTRLRAAGIVPGVVEFGGKPAGYFTAATGITIYRGDALPEDMRGVAIVGDVGSNIVHRKRLTPRGIAFVASRMDEQSEFVRSDDIWFRPVQYANAPDGCLHLLDMYREVIEHPKSLPPEIKKHLDLTSGRNRGRLYRVTPENYTYRPAPQLSAMSSAELVGLLSHKNSWHREAASRLLFEKQDKSIVPAVKKLAESGESPLGRLHAMSVLHGLGELTEQTVTKALADTHPRIREQALRYAEAFPESSNIIQAINPLTTDEDQRVRYQLAFTAGEFPFPKRIEWLTSLVRTDGTDSWIQMAIESSLVKGNLNVFANLLNDKEFRNDSRGVRKLSWLVQQIARGNNKEELEGLMQQLEGLPENEAGLKTRFIVTLLSSGGKGMARQLFQGPRAQLWEDLLTRSRDTLSTGHSLGERLVSIRLLRLSTDPADLDRLLDLLNPAELSAVQSAALASLSASKKAKVAEEILNRWQEMSPAIRLEAEEVLFSRPDWTALALERIESGKLPASEFSSARLKTLASGKNAKLKVRAAKILKSMGNTSRGEIVKKYTPALDLQGDVSRGRAVFRKQCAGCHRLENVGNETGPNLAAMRNRGREAILLNVLDPNREVNPAYLNYVVALQDGRTLTGIIRSETATSLTLLRAENKTDEVLRKDIEQIRSSGLSLMPEGLEKNLDMQAMADLIAYLMHAEPKK